MSEVYLLFYQAALQIFVHINKLLQREDPIISIMRGQLNSFLKKLFGRFVTITAIQAADMDISSLDYNNPSNQLPGNIGNLYLYLTTTSSTPCFRHRFIGIMTRQFIRRLEEGGDVTPRQVKEFHTAV